MAQVAVKRLKMLWPAASIHMLAETSEDLKTHFPGTVTVSMHSCKKWMRSSRFLDYLLPSARMPGVRIKSSTGLSGILQLRNLLLRLIGGEARQFAQTLGCFDLVVLSGAGVITDSLLDQAITRLKVFEAAIECGIPTVIFSQGLGPIENKSLFKRTAKVLLSVDALFLREGKTGPRLVNQMKMAKSRVTVTGDDAMELALPEGAASLLGRNIGANLRLASYSGLGEETVATLRAVLLQKAHEHQTTIVGIPITLRGKKSDLRTLKCLLAGMPDEQNEPPQTTAQIIRKISSCRLVVSGSYHAGVFALAQGIPVVAIVQSAYYADKFLGLAGQFGCGCIILRADDPHFAKNIGIAISKLWSEAEALKPKLIESARAQVRQSRAAYERLPAMLNGKLGRRISENACGEMLPMIPLGHEFQGRYRSA
jgi:colanic acid/amylovoran biosynthesis protein